MNRLFGLRWQWALMGCLVAPSYLCAQPRLRVAQQEASQPPGQAAPAIPDAPATQFGLPKGADPYVQNPATSKSVPSLLDAAVPPVSGAPAAPGFAAPGGGSGGLLPPTSDPWQGQVYDPAAGANQAPSLNLVPRDTDGSVFWGEPIRFLQGPRVRYTWLAGGDTSSSLDVSDFDASVVFAIPNFLQRGQPFYVAPSFGLHLWDGPRRPNPADLPSKAFSAYLDSGWRSDPGKAWSTELGVRVGVFTDFDTFTTHSLRILGQGLLHWQATPAVKVRAGVAYLDRNGIKVLPVGGLLWEPNNQTRFDFYFPTPKLAQYLTTLGNYDFWWYVGGEFGGGSWTIKRADGRNDRIDINDVRMTLGLEFGGQALLAEGRRLGFLELGYVFAREIRYVATPSDSFDVGSTIMLRTGIGY
ncbi:MAG: hypothetical protein ABGX05_19780 [Pirellulaceae bacterium]